MLRSIPSFLRNPFHRSGCVNSSPGKRFHRRGKKWRKERETAAISKAHCFVSSHVDETNQGETREKIFGPSKKLMRIFLGFGDS
ncbi:hypothetical protein ACLOJK_028067 [Asimina triloba]